MVSPNSICVVHKFGVSKSNGDVIIRIEIVLILYNVTKLSHTNILLVANRFFVKLEFTTPTSMIVIRSNGVRTRVYKKRSRHGLTLHHTLGVIFLSFSWKI